MAYNHLIVVAIVILTLINIYNAVMRCRQRCLEQEALNSNDTDLGINRTNTGERTNQINARSDPENQLSLSELTMQIREDRRLRILTGVVHKKAVAEKTNDGKEELKLPHERELSDRRLQIDLHDSTSDLEALSYSEVDIEADQDLELELEPEPVTETDPKAEREKEQKSDNVLSSGVDEFNDHARQFESFDQFEHFEAFSDDERDMETYTNTNISIGSDDYDDIDLESDYVVTNTDDQTKEKSIRTTTSKTTTTTATSTTNQFSLSNPPKPKRRELKSDILLSSDKNESNDSMLNTTAPLSEDGEEEEYSNDNIQICTTLTHESGEKEVGESKSELYSPKTCAICLEAYTEGDDICWSKNEKCPHAFHLDCMTMWLMDNDECPLCRENYLDLEHRGQTRSYAATCMQSRNRVIGIGTTFTY